MNNPVLSSFTALALKVVAVVLLVSSLLDYIMLAIPFKPLDSEWQISFTSQLVDRGIVPMVGIALLAIAYWIGEMSDIGGGSRNPFTELRFWAFTLASLLGLLFLLLIPLHVSNLSQANAQQLKQIDEQASVAENQIQQRTEQINALLKDEQRLQELDEAIEKGEAQGQKLSPEQLQQLQEIRQQVLTLRQDPSRLEEEINRIKTTVLDRRTELEAQARTNAIKNGVRIGISSLLLSLGYIAIGWMGFKTLGASAGGGRRRK